MNMFGFNRNEFDPGYQQAIREGFDMAEEYFTKAVREFYRDMKRKKLSDMATTSTTSSHKCNCEFCWTNEPKKV